MALSKEELAQRRREAAIKARKSALHNRLNELLLKYTRQKDWEMVLVLSAALYLLMERGEI